MAQPLEQRQSESVRLDYCIIHCIFIVSFCCIWLSHMLWHRPLCIFSNNSAVQLFSCKHVELSCSDQAKQCDHNDTDTQSSGCRVQNLHSAGGRVTIMHRVTVSTCSRFAAPSVVHNDHAEKSFQASTSVSLPVAWRVKLTTRKYRLDRRT